MKTLRYIITVGLLLFFNFFLKAQERDIDFKLIMAAYNDSIPAVEKLLADSASVNAKTEDGVTPLMYAAENGDSAMIEILLNHGADVNDKPEDGFTALISSCLFNHLEASIILIENGADINAQNMYGATPLMIAAAYGYYIIADMLLFYGAGTEISDSYGNTALNIAATNGFDDIVSLLLEKGAQIESKDNEGYTPLMSAIIQNNYKVVNVLLNNKADVNSQNNNGYTPMMIAIKNHNDSLINRLNVLPIDKELETTYGQNTADIALLNKNHCMYRCLNNKKTFYKPCLKSANLSSGLSLSLKDILFVNSLGISESRYGLHLYTGYASRIGKKKILVSIQDNEYNQYNEKRSYIFSGISKDFTIKYKNDKEMGINAGINAAYTFGSIEGTQTDVINKYLFVPSIGYYFTYSFYTFKLNYEYIDFKTYKLSPHKLTISFCININVKKNPKFTKSIYWII